MVAIAEHGRLISTDKVQGTRVINPAGEELGHIHEIMIDKPTGQVAYAVLKYGSFLGLGGKLFALPWDILVYDRRHHAYLIDLPEDRLREGPNADSTDRLDLGNFYWNRQVHEYYGSAADWYRDPWPPV